MNKKLVALAVAGAFALPMAAQAQTANVTLYGRANLDMEFVNGKLPDGTNPTTYRVSSNSSRLGFRGTESLGGGLNAIFQLESGVPWDAGGGTLGGRETFVGLQGSWGTFKMGRFLQPYDDIHPIFGNVPTLTTSILSTAVLWGQGQIPTPTGVTPQQFGNFDDRAPNSIRYDSPTINGFNFEAQYGASEFTNPGQTHGGSVSLGGFYNNGPLQLGAAYERHIHERGPNLNDDAFSIAGGYQFGIFRIGAVYQHLKYEIQGTCTPAPCTPGSAGDLKGDMWGVSGTVNLGPGQLYLFYGDEAKGKGSAPDGSRVGGLTKGPDTSAQQYEISYTYPLSKRTLTYAGWVKLENKSNAAYTFNINNYNTCGVGQTLSAQLSSCGSAGKPQGFVFGLVHFF